VDMGMVSNAAVLAAEDKVRSAKELHRLTGGKVSSVDAIARLPGWLLERLPGEGVALLTKREEEADDDGVVTRPTEYQLTRKQVERLNAYVSDLIDPGATV